jgi:glycosyltransferase involved in cell wall biosynthesis
MIQKRKIYFNAAGINNGGGMVLFESLINSLKNYSFILLLDIRLSSKYKSLIEMGSAIVVKKSFLQRAIFNFRASREAASDDVIFCFNSLPPLVKSKAFTITYIHSPQFVGLHKNSNYSFIDSLRFFIETTWFRFTYRNSDELWVQTENMKSLLNQQFQNIKVQVVPFIDDRLYELYNENTSVNREALDNSEDIFFYPAGFTGHKNHKILLEAFRKLELLKKKVRLIVTLPDESFKKLSNGNSLNNVTNLGPIEREKVISLMKSSSALIFPSKAETFGIPLIEATALRLPIIASDLGFVRNVCSPDETFDPDSLDSIVDAMIRFLSSDRRSLGNNLSAPDKDLMLNKLLSSQEFIEKIYTIQ